MPSDVPGFADSIISFARKARTLSVEGCGFPGGASEQHMYQAKSWCRQMLLMVEGMMPEAFDEVTVARTLAWAPDENEHLAPLQSLTGAEAREKLGIPILLLGYYACYTASLPIRDAKPILGASHADIMAPVLEYLTRKSAEPEECSDPAFPPLPHIIHKDLGMNSGARSRSLRRGGKST